LGRTVNTLRPFYSKEVHSTGKRFLILVQLRLNYNRQAIYYKPTFDKGKSASVIAQMGIDKSTLQRPKSEIGKAKAALQ